MSNSFIAQVLEWFSDKFTRFLTQISGDHRYIHEGKAFSVIGNTGSVSAASSYVVSITTPPMERGFIHLRPAIIGASANLTSVTIAEGATVTGGTASIPVNLNRNSKKASFVDFRLAPTVGVAGGTTIYQEILGTGGSTPARAGGAGGAEHERVLKPNTTYTITFTVIGASTASTAYYDIWWYEEEMGV